MPPITLPPIPTRDAVRLFRHLMELIPAYWQAQMDERLSVHIAPPAELEEALIELVELLWRSIGSAIRAGDSELVLRSEMEPDRLETSLMAAQRMLAFVPYAHEAGIGAGVDPEALEVLEKIIQLTFDEIRAGREAAAGNGDVAAADTPPDGPITSAPS